MASSSIKALVSRGLREAGLALKSHVGHEFFTRHRPNMTFYGVEPFKTNDTFVAPSASVIGEVINWDESSIWYGAVVRADSGHSITIGFSSNIQDGAVVTTIPDASFHSSGGETKKQLETGFPPVTHVGHYVSVGAGSVLISCRIDDLVIIGEKCTIMEGSYVESHVILEPGTVVPAYSRIPSGQKWGGNPATFVANLTIDELEYIPKKAESVFEQAYEHMVEFLPVGNTYIHLEELEKKDAASMKQA